MGNRLASNVPVFAFALMVASCSTVPAPADPAERAPRAGPDGSGAEVPTRTSSGLHLEGVHSWEEVAPPGHPTRFTVERVSGTSKQRVEDMVEAASAQLDDCVGPHAGKVSVRVARERGALAVSLVQSASLDPFEEKCVLDALSRITASTAAGSGEPRSDGFTSLISIEW